MAAETLAPAAVSNSVERTSRPSSTEPMLLSPPRVVARRSSFLCAMAALLAVVRPLGAQSTVAGRSAPHGRFLLPVGGVTVPLLPGQRPVVQATVNGRGPFRLLVETGSPVSYLLPAAYQQAFPSPPSEQDTIRVGAAALTGIALRTAPALGVPDIDGLLGLDALYDAAVTIDLGARALHLRADTLPAANGRDIVALSIASVFWAVPMTIGDRSVHAILDTQSALSLSAAPARAAGLPFTTAPVTIGMARGPTIGSVPVQRARLGGSVRFGDIELQQPIIDVLPLAPQLPQDAFIMGLQLLSEFVVTLDQRTARARFARSSRTVPPPPPLYGSGLSAALNAQGLRAVSFVVDGFPAADAGIAVGDLIVTINDREVRAVSDTEWRALLAGRDPVRLRVRRADVERTVALTPRALGF